MTALRITIAKSIRYWRELRGLTQPALAAAAGLSVDTVGRLEHLGAGRDRTPSVDALERLAKALDIPPGVLVGAGWCELVRVMRARVRPERTQWVAESGMWAGTGRTPEAAVLSLYEQWIEEQE